MVHQTVTPSHYTLALNTETWSRITTSLQLSPQQTRVVSLILEGRGDKQIAAHMGISVATVRTQITRVFQRNQLESRVALVLRIFAIAQSHRETASCRHQR